jgi:hypothetical protein
LPATPPTGTDPGLIHTLIDRVAIHFSEGVYADEAASARADYFWVAGELREEDSELFEPRMAAFLEWYVIERPLGLAAVPAGHTPVSWFQQEAKDQLSPEEQSALHRLLTSRRSLFCIKKVTPGNVVLTDLLGGDDVTAFERRGTLGFTTDDLCEARVCESDNGFIFTKTLLFHPRDAAKEIKNGVKAALQAGEERDAILGRLARANLRWTRQGHVSADRIYREIWLRPPGGERTPRVERLDKQDK